MVMVETTKKYICEKYICEICFAKYETRYKAEQCEKRGKRKPKFNIPARSPRSSGRGGMEDEFCNIIVGEEILEVE